MAIPHYAYLKLKVPGPKGVITIDGNFTISNDCDRHFSKLSESFGMQEELAELKQTTDYSDFPISKKSAPDLAFDTSNDTKEVQVHPTDPAKTAFISTSLDPK